MSILANFKKLNVSFSLRAFVVYFVILGFLSWYLVENAIERLNDGMRQSAESVMVDMSHVFASELEQRLLIRSSGDTETVDIDTDTLKQMFYRTRLRQLQAQIYQITKASIDTDVYVTNQQGIVIYDSTGQYVGDDFSGWRDVRLTLLGEYGARTSFIDPEKTDNDDEKIMVVAAPIRHGDTIVGVVSVVKSINSLEGHLQAESTQLKNYALVLVLLAIIVGYVFSLWLTRSLEKIAQYAYNLAKGHTSKQPHFLDQRLDNLASSVTTLRNQLDGKEYVEDYIHSLTHELKTPITSIRGATELLTEGLPADEQTRFINNIHSSNNRMAQLVDKMLSLAKLESQTELVEWGDFDLAHVFDRLIEERQPQITRKSIQLSVPKTSTQVNGDRLLIRQAIANLLDNAIAFCPQDGAIQINTESSNNQYFVTVFNQGDNIPDYALARVFERFFSMPANSVTATHSTAKSTGLGLSFVQEIMKLHNGSVQLSNIKKEQQKYSGVIACLRWAKP